MKIMITRTFIVLFSFTLFAADDMRDRDQKSRLDKPVYGSIDGALAVAKQNGKSIFAVIYNPKNTQGLSSNDRCLMFWADNAEVRTLIKVNFVQLFMNRDSQSTKKYVTKTEEITTPLIVVFDNAGKVIAREPMSDSYGALAQVNRFIQLQK